MTRRTLERFSAVSSVLALGLALAGCGGGAGLSENTTDPDAKPPTGFGTNNNAGGSGPGFGNNVFEWTGTFLPANQFAAKCVSPRKAEDGWNDVKGTVLDENNWLRSMTNDTYLWYSEVFDRDPSLYKDPIEYFDLLKTTKEVSGQPKDRFHFTYPTDYWQSLSTSGQDISYGVSVALLSTTPPRKAVVAYVEPGAPTSTTNAGITRGVEITAVDGVDLVNDNSEAGVDKINAALFPSASGQSHTFSIRELNGTQRTVTLTSAIVVTQPVLNTQVISTSSGPVGYLLFNDHIATSESQLFNAITTLKASGIADLVLDIRYNGGGYLDIASELAYMIAGPTATGGQTFEKLQFNDKHPETDPVTGDPLAPTPFYNRSQGFDPALAENTTLPSLNLPRVFVLTGDSTCSASESIINGLRGVNVEVIQIGSTTCGKPYGFYPLDNCGTTYFTIQFRGVNAKNYGDYTNGFYPGSSSDSEAQIKGCTVADDFSKALGNTGENLLETALAYRTAGACVALQTDDASAGPSLSSMKAQVLKSEWRMNRVLRR